MILFQIEKLILNNITKISFQMEIKKNESAIMFEKNERMRLETAVTSTTSTLLDMEDRLVIIFMIIVL